MSNVNMWEIESSVRDEGYEIICGVDEAGRGPLAGPVCAAAVILPMGLEIPGLTDSKKLTDKKRRELFPVIKEQAIAYGIGLASHEEIDEINILQATYLAMERALAQLSVNPDIALIDGYDEVVFLLFDNKIRNNDGLITLNDCANPCTTWSRVQTYNLGDSISQLLFADLHTLL